MAIVKVSDLLNRSLRAINVVPHGQSADEYVLDDCLMTLNEFLESMNREGLQFFERQRTQHTTQAGLGAYYIGTGEAAPHINIVRPDEIEGAGVFINAGQQQLERPLGIIRNSVEWQQIPLKQLQQNLVQRLYYDAAMNGDPNLKDGNGNLVPSGIVNYYPVPNNAQTIVLYTTVRFADITDLSTVFNLPDGTLRFLRTNLAIEFASEMPQAIVSPLLVEAAEESKAILKAANQRNFVLRCPPELVGTDSGFYDYRSDELRV